MGVPVTGTIQTTDPATDTYAVIDPAEGIDGWRSVADHAARNAITTLRRREGMAVYCRSDPLGTFYQLNPAPWDGTDADWTQITAGGGSGTVTSVATGTGLTGGTITTTGTISLADLAASSLLGNPTGSAASPSEITLGTGLEFAGTTLRATGGFGTVTSVGAGTGLTGGTITGAGTIALDVPVSGIHGGTGLTSAVVGDILYAALTNTWSALGGNTTTTKKYLTGTGTGSAAQAPAWGTIAAADLPTTGLTITQHAGTITTDTDGATITFDLSASDWHQVQLGGNRTLALSNPTTGQQFTIVLQQDGSTRTVTWFSGILWPGGTIPTLTAGGSKRDAFTFKCISAGVYLGFAAGLNM